MGGPRAGCGGGWVQGGKAGVRTDSVLLQVWRRKEEVSAVGKCQTPAVSPPRTPRARGNRAARSGLPAGSRASGLLLPSSPRAVSRLCDPPPPDCFKV